MMEIYIVSLVLSVLLALLMGFGKDGKGAIIYEKNIITLGALANATTKKADGQIALTEDFRLIKSEIMVVAQGVAAGDAPLCFGIADNELTEAEIAEVMEQSGPVDKNDNLRSERAMRPVWPLMYLGDGDEADVPQDGIYEKVLRWTFSDADGWVFFIHNDTGGALTTGAVVRFRAKHFGVWVT